MAAAERILRPGGVIVMAAACEDGIPAGGAFARLLAGARTPSDLLGASGGPELDRWQAQVLGRVLARAEVHLCSEGLEEEGGAGVCCARRPTSTRPSRLRGRGWAAGPGSPSCRGPVDGGDGGHVGLTVPTSVRRIRPGRPPTLPLPE